MSEQSKFSTAADFFNAVVKESRTGIVDERLEEKPGEREKWEAIEKAAADDDVASEAN